MGGASDGTFFDGPAPYAKTPEDITIWDIADFRDAIPEQVALYINTALARGNNDMAYFALGVLASRATEPDVKELKRGILGRARLEVDPEAHRLRTRRWEALGSFLRYFAHFNNDGSSKSSSSLDDQWDNFRGTVNN